MSGQRQFIYLNKRPKPPDKWEDISCGPLECAVDVFVGFFIISILVAVIIWCLT